MIIHFLAFVLCFYLPLAQEPAPHLPPWVSELLAAILSLVMIAILIYWFRPSKSGSGSSDFTITVDGPDVSFRGKFPARLEPSVESFLLEDCQIDGRYQVRGRWEEQRLVIVVQGDNAAPFEQRIRNYLKLHYKTPNA